MTPRERFQAAFNGQVVSPKPTIGTDLALTAIGAQKSDVPTFTMIPSPLTQAIHQNLDLLNLLAQDPTAGNQKLDELYAATAIMINNSIPLTDGICYLIDGAYPEQTTPMQYGGYFLERDRHTLEAAFPRTKVMLLIAGDQDPFIDFVSDLPAHIFAWDAKSKWTPSQIRELRSGILAADWPDAEFHLPDHQLQTALQPREAATL
jgi:hypothetical protein